MIQYAVALRDSAIADPGSGSNGFESDNDGSGSTNTPVTNPIFSNVSMFGPKVTPTTTINTNYKRAMHLRRNTQIDIYNSFFAGYKDGLFVDGSAARQNLADGELLLYGITLAYCSGNYFPDDTLDVVRNYFFEATRNNDTLTDHALLMITDPFNYGDPDFRPQAGSPVLSDAIFTGISESTANVYGDVVVYPNPATDVVNVEYQLVQSGNVTVELLDLGGRSMGVVFNGSQETGFNSIQINTSSLCNGVYFIRLAGENNTHILRFIK